MKDNYRERIDIPWIRISSELPYDGEWGLFTDNEIVVLGRYKHDALNHLYPCYGPESFDIGNVVAWCPLPNLPKDYNVYHGYQGGNEWDEHGYLLWMDSKNKEE